jgi:hypothetical protein
MQNPVVLIQIPGMGAAPLPPAYTPTAADEVVNSVLIRYQSTQLPVILKTLYCIAGIRYASSS